MEHRVLNLSQTTIGHVYHLNYPQASPEIFEFTQYLIAPLGHVISIELHGMQFGDNDCHDNTSVQVGSFVEFVASNWNRFLHQIYDKYAERNGTVWRLCRASAAGELAKNSISQASSVIIITSYLNTLHVRQRSVRSDLGLLNATVRVHSGRKP